MLWGRAAGRCEFAGCNHPLTHHPETKEAVNLAEAAHIVGFSEDGPRGEKELSHELARDIENLMLLCRVCHRTIDEKRAAYAVDLLRGMKAEHERRIALLSSIAPEKKSHVVLYGANIGEHSAPLSYHKAAGAMFPDWYPADTHAIELGVSNSAQRDRSDAYWPTQQEQVRALVAERIRPRLANGEVKHLSIFACAPQPLLMYLGYLLCDLPAAEVYQLHREPPDWKWQGHPEGFEYHASEPPSANGTPALVFSLSATVADDRILLALPGAAIWRIAAPAPNNDVLRSREQLRLFRQCARRVLDRIKAVHGEDAILHVFPAMPVSAAVEFGRIIMPKADLHMLIYDQNRVRGGFVPAVKIHAEKGPAS